MNHELRTLRRTVAAISVASAALILAAAAVSAGAPGPTKGSVPEAAMRAGEDIDMSLVPDFVATSGPTGDIVGYVATTDLVPRAVSVGRPQARVIPVFGEDLQTLVGHLYPSKGFVPLGVDPAMIPEIPAVVGPADATAP